MLKLYRFIASLVTIFASNRILCDAFRIIQNHHMLFLPLIISMMIHIISFMLILNHS